MTAQTMEANSNGKGPAFEWWMVSFFAVGAGFSAFVSLLIPPFVTEATGSAADAGIVMAIISLAAVLGPVLGGWLANQFGYNAINWMAAISVGAAVLLIFVSLWPAERKKRAEEAAAVPSGG